MQGEPKQLSISFRDLWPNCYDTEMNLILDLGELANYHCGDMSTILTWISSESIMNSLKFVTGTLKRDVTPQEAEEHGAGKFLFRFHILPQKKDSVRVWVSLLPGTQESQRERLRQLLGHPSFPALSYELSHKTNKDKKGAALRLKATNQNMGTYCLALVENTLAAQGAEPAVVDPMSYLTSIKGLLRKGLWPNKALRPALATKLEP